MLRRAIETREPPVAVVAGIGMPAWRLIMLALGLLVVAVIPFVLKNFFIFQITLAIIYAIAILGLNLLTGFNGQFSLGHSAFYAIGAYTAAIMMDGFDINYAWTLPAAAIVCFIFGFLFGLPALRLEGVYLALAPFSVAVALFVGLVVGGTGSIPGTFFGGLFVLFVPNIAEQFSKGLAGAVYGVILLLVIYLMPTGAAGLVRLISSRLVQQGRAGG